MSHDIRERQRRAHLYFGLMAAALGAAGIAVCATGVIMSALDGQIAVAVLLAVGLAFAALVTVEGARTAHEAHQEGKP
jgi:hypothetical protein